MYVYIPETNAAYAKRGNDAAATALNSKKVRPIQMERIVLRKYVSRRLLALSGAGSGLVRKVEQNLWQSSISSPPSGSQAASHARWLEF